MASLNFCEIISIAWSFTTGKIAQSCRLRFSEVITVSTKSGPVKGYKTRSAFDYHYINFFGIPYAKPPLGDLRFKEPQPFEPSNDVINLRFQRDSSMASQCDFIMRRQAGAEDCLHLSVYTRDVKPETLKPVMVWIHGGALMYGSNSKDLSNPEFLLRNDVVVIAINYRLGAFGFISLNDPELKVPGNAGLKDQCMALKWVRENCANFGGDPNNITIFGVSAGAVSVHLHTVSEMSKDLFHKAIVMSGTIHSPFTETPVKDWTQRLSRKLGWDGEGGDKASLAVLQNASTANIAKAQEDLITADDRSQYIFFPLGVVVEPYETEQCFLPKDPKLLAETAWSKNIPMIIGACSNEGLMFYKMLMKESSELEKVNLVNAVPFLELGLDPESETCKRLGHLMKRFYFGLTPISKDTILTYLMLLGDKLLVHPSHRSVSARVRNGSAPTYLYRFDFSSNVFNLTKKLLVGKDVPGVCHGDDVMYTFRNVFDRVPARTSKEWKMMERLCACWTQFARTGNPNNNTISPVEWEPAELAAKDAGGFKCMNFDEEVSFIDAPEMERLHFWNDLYQQNHH